MKTKTKQTLKSIVEKSKFNYVYPPILEKPENQLQIPERNITDYKVFRFTKTQTTEKVQKEIEKEGYTPANWLELLEWEKTNKENGWFVAPDAASVFVYENGHRCFLGVYRDDGDRVLDLTDVGGSWRDYWAFLAIRNSESKTLTPSSSDTLNLKKFVSDLKNLIKKYENI